LVINFGQTKLKRINYYQLKKVKRGCLKVEIGHVIFLSFYLLAVIISCIPSYQKNKNNHLYVSVGASGGTSAIVFSYILFNPLAGFYLMFIPIEIPAILFGIAYLAYSYYMSYQAKDNIAHDVHFFGALFGIIFTLLLNEGIFSYFLLQLQQW
jgi:membrane associated rhomboid family serine protease